MKRYCYLLLLLFIIAGCAKTVKTDPANPDPDPIPNPPVHPTDSIPQGKNQLAAHTYLIDSSSILDLTDASITLKADSLTRTFQENYILIAAPNSSYPFGFLRKVLHIEMQGDRVNISTAPASLNEAFKTLSIDTTFQTAYSESGKMSAHPATVLDEDAGIHITLDFGSDSIYNNGIVLNGILKLNIPKVKILFEKQPNSFQPQHVLVQADLNTQGSTLEIINTNNSRKEAPEKLLKRIPLPPLTLSIPIPTPIGIIPLPVKLSQEIQLNVLPFLLEGKFKFNVNPIVYGTLGVEYKNGSWNDICNSSVDAQSFTNFCQEDFLASFDFTSSLTIFNPRYSIRPYDLKNLEGYFEVPNKLIFKVATSPPGYELKYNMDVSGGVKTRFWDGVDQDFSISGHVIDKSLQAGTFSICDACKSFDQTAWWYSLDGSVQQAFNELIGYQGTTIPDSAGFKKLFDKSIVNLEGKNLQGDLEIPPCFTRIYSLWLGNNSALHQVTVHDLPTLEVLRLDNDRNLSGLSLNALPILSTLYCSNTNLEELDVSACKNLANLRCNNNNLNILNIGDISNLLELSCYQNQLSDLNVSQLNKLTSLDVRFNKLNQLTLGDHPNLIGLWCNNNELSTLDLSHCLKLRELYFGNNNLSTLTNFAFLKDLEILYCTGSHLSELNISGNIHLKELYCDSNQLHQLQSGTLPTLEKLYCNTNQFDSLDARSFPNIKKLLCGDNHLTQLHVSGLTALQQLDFSKNNISQIDVSNLPSLNSLGCNWNPLGYNGVMQILQTVAPSVSVSFNCSGNNIAEKNGPDPNNPSAGSDCNKVWDYYNNR